MKDAVMTQRASRRSLIRFGFSYSHQSRLLRRTFLIAFLLVSGGLVTSGIVELFFRYRESVKSIHALQREMAQNATFKIQQFVETITQTLREITQTSEIITTGLTDSYRFQLLKLLRVVPAITTAVAMDITGHEKIKVSRLEMVRPGELTNRARDAAFIEARTGASFFGPVYFVRQSEPYMRIAVPIEPFAGEVIGVLMAEVNLKYIWEVVSRIQVGHTGYAYVVSQQGDLIAHPDISLVLQKRNLNHLGQVQTALAGGSGTYTYANLRGNDVFTTYVTIPELGWAVLVERSSEEAYAPLYASLGRMACLLLMGLGMAGVASMFISRRVVKPMETLRQGAQIIGSGALHHRIGLQTGDELEALADAFNHMAVRLQASYANLEDKVATRTRELTRSVEELRALGEIGQAVNSTLDLPTVLTTIVSRAVQFSNAQGGLIYEYDASRKQFELRATHGTPPRLIAALQAAPIALGEGALGRAAATRSPVQVADIRDEQVVVQIPARPLMAQAGYRSLLTVPLMLEQRIMGGLMVWRHEPGDFSADLLQLLQTFAAQSSLAIQNAQIFRELADRERAVEIASQHKSHFLASMSHELRTPLHAILGYTELTLDDIYGPVPEPIREVLERVQYSGRHLLGLINAVLDLSRIEAGRLELASDDYVLPEIVQLAVTALEQMAADKQLTIGVTLPSHLPTGRGDAQRLTQVLLNLVGNAIAYTEAGHIEIDVTVSGGMFTMAVTDTGPGIAPEDQKRIFEAFEQAETPAGQAQRGTGLGLAICKHIIEMHGGSIGVRSRLQQGSTFWCTFPVRFEPTSQEG